MRELKEALRKAIIGTTEVRSLIGDRFYPGHLAKIPNPVYPCACFSVDGGNPDPDMPPISMPTFNIWVYSKNSFDESWRIYEKIKKAIHHSLVSTTEGRWITKEDTNPFEVYDDIGKIYFISAGWRAGGIVS